MSKIMWSIDCIDTEPLMRGLTVSAKISTFVMTREGYTQAINDLKEQHFLCDSAIKKVIFNDRATIILWQNGTKTVVKCQNGDTYDKEKGFLLCYLKGIVGNKTLLKELDKWVNKEKSE